MIGRSLEPKCLQRRDFQTFSTGSSTIRGFGKFVSAVLTPPSC